MTIKLKLLILVLTFFACTGCAVNPITGQNEFMLFPESQDFEIGRLYAPEFEKELGGKIEDDDLQNYIDSIGQKIARFGHKPNWEYHFVALKHHSINAFALPGGYIFITKGMLEKLETESQLAAILAHEIVHVIARDTSNAISKHIGIGMLLTAAIPEVATSEESAQGALAAAQVIQLIIALQYSRQDERQADLGGIDYMVVAGYNPTGMVETMQMLEKESETRQVEFLSSHPSPQHRVAYLSQKIQSGNYPLSDLRIGKDTYRATILDRLPNLPDEKHPLDHLPNEPFTQ
ncbi:MAG: M48 family metalloprotease [Phycisphaerales bacterium]|jgi:predicted Zn-dependent protease